MGGFSNAKISYGLFVSFQIPTITANFLPLDVAV